MKSELSRDYSALIQHANEIRTRQIADDRKDAALLVAELVPLPCKHPHGDDGTSGITWSEDEYAKLLDLCKQAKEASKRTEDNPEGTDWDRDTENNKKYLALKIAEAIMTKFFPPHRRRFIGGVSALPTRMKKPFREVFQLKDPGTMPLDAPLIKEELNRLTIPATTGPARIWNGADETALLNHLSQAMRKQWGPNIPEGSDRLGSIMFKDMIIAAQNETVPPERRRDLTHARQVLQNLGMLDRLQKILNEIQPAKSVPVPVTVTSAPAPATTNLAVAQANQAAPVKANATALAGMLRSVADFLETELATAHREAHDAQQISEMVMQENSELRNRLGTVEEKLSQMGRAPVGAVAAPIVKKALPRVAILGCHLDEFTHIIGKARALGLELEFKHYPQDSAPTIVRSEYALMLKWASGDWIAKLKESGISAAKRAIVHQGGISRAVMQLEAWFAPEHAELATA